ncbi:hypothetical protein TKK_0010435 [Trichogramma kaykai]
MYRLLNVRAVSLPRDPSIHIVNTKSICFISNGFNTRSLDRLCTRQFSTTINKALLSSSTKKRIIRKKNKQYAELLEVTDSSSSNKKAAVQKLNAAQLSMLVDQPEITLDKLHKIEAKAFKKKSKVGSISQFSTNSVNRSIIDKVTLSSDTFGLHAVDGLDNVNDILKSVGKADRDVIVQELSTSDYNDDPVVMNSRTKLDNLTESESEKKIFDSSSQR